jgi:hypothetical protein
MWEAWEPGMGRVGELWKRNCALIDLIICKVDFEKSFPSITQIQSTYLLNTHPPIHEKQFYFTQKSTFISPFTPTYKACSWQERG